MKLSQEFKESVLNELLGLFQKSGKKGAPFARQYGIDETVFNRLLNHREIGILSDEKWMLLGSRLGVRPGERKWQAARTAVFNAIEEDIMFCKQYSKAMMFVDDCGIGKTFTAKYLSNQLDNCFYVDASQCKSKMVFVETLARTIGIKSKESHTKTLEKIKYALHAIQNPIIIIDEAGDLEYNAFLELKSLWNATENICGWYLMGAECLKVKIERGIKHERVGFREVFSRFSEVYSSVVPVDRQDKMQFYKKLIADVLTINLPEEKRGLIPGIIKQCITDVKGEISGLRRAESLLILNS